MNSSADRNSIVIKRVRLQASRPKKKKTAIFTRHKLMFHFNHVLSSHRIHFAVYCLFYETIEFKIWFWKWEKNGKKKSRTLNNSNNNKTKTENSFINNQIDVHHLVQPSTLSRLALEAFRDFFRFFFPVFFLVLIPSRVRLVCICHRQMDSGHHSNGWKRETNALFGSENLLGKWWERTSLTLMQSKFTHLKTQFCAATMGKRTKGWLLPQQRSFAVYTFFFGGDGKLVYRKCDLVHFKCMQLTAT